MRVGIITQARTTSTRLPRKVLLQASERTFLDHHLDRLESTTYPVFVATTTNGSDDEIVELAAGRGLDAHRGSEHDVLARFYGCAVAHQLDVVVRVTSDCPLIDGELVRSGVEQFLREDDPDIYLSNTLVRTYPRGFDFEVFSMQRLEQAHMTATTPVEREHVTPFLYSGSASGVRKVSVEAPMNNSRYRVTLDTAEDRALITTLIEDFGAARLTGPEIIDVLAGHPELVALNAEVEQKKV